MIINNKSVTTSVTTCHDLSRVSPYVLLGLNLVNLSYYHQRFRALCPGGILTTND